MKVKELEKLLLKAKNPKYIKQIKIDLTSYRAIKLLIDSANKNNK